MALKAKALVITGGPGVGKTTIVKGRSARNPQLRLAMAAQRKKAVISGRRTNGSNFSQALNHERLPPNVPMPELSRDRTRVAALTTPQRLGRALAETFAIVPGEMAGVAEAALERNRGH